MKKTDLSAAYQKRLVALDEYPGAYALVPPPTPRHIPLPGIQNEVALAHESLGTLQALSSKLPNPNLLTRTLDRREAVRSSQIEGTHSGVNDVLMYEATGDDDGLPPDVVVTLNYVRALEYGLSLIRKQGKTALDSTLIKGLHAHLMDGVTDFSGAPGEFRQKQNWIGSFKIYQARFVPPPHTYLQQCMDDLVQFLQYAPREEDQVEIPIVIRMAIAHAQFETIHPFSDGNGRVGRLLLPLMLAAEGYPPVYIAGFLKDNQREYYDSLAQVQLQGKWTEWVRFFATGIQEACRESTRTAEALESLLSGWKDLVSSLRLRSDSAVHRLPDVLIGTPVVTAKHLKDVLDISFPAANNALILMEQHGVLVQPKQQQRNRVFVAKEVVEILDQQSSV